MHICLVYLVSVFSLFSDSSIYNINVTDAGGQQVSLSAFAGRKIMIIAFNAGSPDATQLLSIDAIQKANPKFVVIGVPANDLSQAISDSSAFALQVSLKLNLMLTRPMYVRKASGDKQSALFKWLTNVNLNTHFDREVDQEGLVYLVNEKGVLYGILGKESNSTFLNTMMNETINQQ